MSDQLREMYDLFFGVQGGNTGINPECAICKERTKLDVDRDPTCECCERGCEWCVRGLLCQECRTGFNFLFDRREAGLVVLENAVSYASRVTKEHQRRLEDEPVAHQKAREAYGADHPPIVVPPLLRKKHVRKPTEAEEMLLTYLAGGPLTLDQLRAVARTKGITWRTVEDAKSRLRIRSLKAGFPARVTGWELPPPEDTTAP